MMYNVNKLRNLKNTGGNMTEQTFEINPKTKRQNHGSASSLFSYFAVYGSNNSNNYRVTQKDKSEFVAFPSATSNCLSTNNQL